MSSPEQSPQSIVERVRAVPEKSWIVGFAVIAAVVLIVGLLRRQGGEAPSSQSVSPSAASASRSSDSAVPAAAPDSGASNEEGASPAGGPAVTPPASDNGTASTLAPIRLDEIVAGLRGSETGVFVLEGGRPAPRRIGSAGAAPSISPDGSRVAYVAPDSTRIAQLYVADIEGGQPQQLTSTPGAKGHPTWSSDGSKIAYSSHETGHYQIFQCNAEGADQKLLIDSPAGVNDVTPEWSPTEDKLAFRSDRDGNNEIYVFSVGDGSTSNVSRSGAIDVAPAWTRDGKLLVWASDREGGKFDLYTSPPDTPGPTRLTHIGGVLFPYCSPDDAHISVTRDRGIQILSRAGEPLETVSVPGVLMRGFAWSRSGNRAAFSRSSASNTSLEKTGHGAARVVAGSFGSPGEATRQAWSLEISGFFSDVRHLNGQWYVIVGEKLSAAEARDLVARLERARFQVRMESGG